MTKIHMESSIYADLKKLAGPIKAKKVSEITDYDCNVDITEITENTENTESIGIESIESTDETDSESSEEERPIERSQKDTKNTKNTKNNTNDQLQNLTVEDIASKVKQLTVMRDANGIIHDTASLVARCERKHIHKYFLRDIMLKDPTCFTCSTGNKFTKLVLNVLESTFELPFIITDSPLEKAYIEFTNPVLKINVACYKTSGLDSSRRVDDKIVISLYQTTSAKKIKDNICKFLVDFPLGEYQHKVKIEVKEPKKKGKKDPLPFTPELAKIMNTPIDQVIDDPKLIMENC